MITKFARLEFELFTKPSKSDFLRVYQPLILTNFLYNFLTRTCRPTAWREPKNICYQDTVGFHSVILTWCPGALVARRKNF
ncbi:MAG: hypothetical protein BA867_02435 [Desulfobacterales bacterium S5133MH16]|nr:MAG: hypothetical protein BA867_02435 [Desulfobacterales bacterium S5133MH16]